VASVTSIARPYDPIRLLQSVLSGLGTAADEGHSRLRPRLWLVTKGGQRVEGHDRARVDVLQSAMWGAARVIAEEHPELWGGMIDIDPSVAEEVCARQVVTEVTSAAPGPQVAYRQENRFVLRLQAADPGPDEEIGLSWRADSAYLITGGMGGIGLHIAASLVALGARRLVLMGRSVMPPRAAWQDLAAGSKEGRQAAAILALEGKGASVHLMQADVADEEDLDRALRQYERESWPAIRGVIHGAGLTENRLSHVMDPGSFERVFAPKARGALLLDRLLPDLDIFILLSSISASLGVAGMANYAAANVALDALAADRRARGVHALSIQWGAWRDTGLHSGEGAARKAEELERQGIFEIPPEQGVKVFAAIHASGEPVLAVMPVDFSVLRTARAGRDLSLFEGRMPSLAEEPGAEGDLTRLLENAATPADRRLILSPLVKELVGAVLKLAPSRLDSRRPLGTMGLTSLMAMELRNRLEALVSRPLSATLAWNYPTVDALVTFLAEGKAPAPAPVAPRAPALATAEAMDLLMDLSDDDAAELLRRK
jgi:myxalamid-type polyketide synthase MxaE and MxaD